jgi:alpha/beta superfamily hydrolase
MGDGAVEESINLISSGIRIEALYREGWLSQGAVLCHPHPLYGGDMHNAVVEAALEAYVSKGFSTLRFNFQGVGGSEGVFDEGRGERENVKAALGYLRALVKGAIHLVGYSFGAWVNSLCAEELGEKDSLVLISPPLAVMDFSPVSKLPTLRLVVTGSRDSYAPREQLRAIMPFWNSSARLEVIEGADHFYYGHLERLKEIIARNIALTP